LLAARPPDRERVDEQPCFCHPDRNHANGEISPGRKRSISNLQLTLSDGGAVSVPMDEKQVAWMQE